MMRLGTLKYAAPLVLVFSLVFLSGIATTAVALQGASAPDMCCEREAGEQVPAGDFECTDLECSCLSCSVSILNAPLDLEASSPAPVAPPWSLASGIPSDHVISIDYPPEIV